MLASGPLYTYICIFSFTLLDVQKGMLSTLAVTDTQLRHGQCGVSVSAQVCRRPGVPYTVQGLTGVRATLH